MDQSRKEGSFEMKIIANTQCDPRILQVHPDYTKMPSLSSSIKRQIKRDVKHYGIHSPLIVTPQMIIIDGVLRKQVALERGWATVPILVVDVPEDATFNLMVQYNQWHRPLSWKQFIEHNNLLPPVLGKVSGTPTVSDGPGLLDELLSGFQVITDRHRHIPLIVPDFSVQSAPFKLQLPIDNWLIAIGVVMRAQDPTVCWGSVAMKMDSPEGFFELLSLPINSALDQVRKKVSTVIFVQINHHPILCDPHDTNFFSIRQPTTDYPTWTMLKYRAKLLEFLSYGDRLWDYIMATYFRNEVSIPS